jgi:hypothetical protein
VVRVLLVQRHPTGSMTVTCVHHHDSVVKVQSSVAGTPGEQKTRGQHATAAVATWRRLWPLGQRVSQKKGEPDNQLLRLPAKR